MELTTMNYVGIGAALVASMVIGAMWYGIFAKPWIAAAGINADELEQKPSLYLIAAICQLTMAVALTGVITHLGFTNLRGGLITAFFCWAGFVATSITVNHRFQDSPWSLTLINCGHWLAVLLAQGAIIGSLAE